MMHDTLRDGPAAEAARPSPEAENEKHETEQSRPDDSHKPQQNAEKSSLKSEGTSGDLKERVPDLDPTEKPDGQHPHGLHGEELKDFPTLDYGLHHRRRRTKIALTFILLFVESCLLPEALFYGLTFGTNLHLQITFAIITALCGTFSPIKFFLGMWRLWRPKTTDKCRPLGQENRYAFDFFHITTTISYWIFIIILIIGTAPHDQITPLISMAAPAFVFWEGIVLLFVQIYYHAGAGAPFRISSTAKGEPVPPAIYPLIEDVVAVEGGGNREYRERLRARYNASPVFRRMLVQLSWFWIVGCFGTVAACAAIVGTTKWYIGYGFGFGVPFVWGYVWAIFTMLWVTHCLKVEKATWSAVTKP